MAQMLDLGSIWDLRAKAAQQRAEMAAGDQADEYGKTLAELKMLDKDTELKYLKAYTAGRADIDEELITDLGRNAGIMQAFADMTAKSTMSALLQQFGN